jgi:hypothetical protein
MTRKSKGAPLARAPLMNAAILAGCDFNNSENHREIQTSRAISWLARRTGMSMSAAAAVAAANAFGGPH